MNIQFLCITLAIAAPLILFALWHDRRQRKRNGKAATATEWRAGMARLDTVRPVASRIDADGRKVWSEKRGKLVKAPATWDEGTTLETKDKVAAIDKRKTGT